MDGRVVLNAKSLLRKMVTVTIPAVAEYQQTGGKPYLIVITGRGSHSQGGVARIRPAAIRYLTSHNFR